MKYQTGLTLIELMITLVIAAVLLMIAIPQFNDMVRRNQLRAESANLHSALAYARSVAISENVAVAICGRSAGVDDCVADTATSWPEGWLIYTNEDEDGVLCADLADCILRKHAEPSAQVEVTSGAGWLGFDDRGELIEDGADEVSLCGQNSSNNLFTYFVAVSGSFRSVKETVGNCP